MMQGLNGRPRVVAFSSLIPEVLDPARARSLAERARYDVRFSIGERTLRVRFSLASAAEAFAARFGDTLAIGDREACVCAYAVDDDERGASYFWCDPATARVWPERADDRLRVFFAEGMVMDGYFRSNGDVGLHAAVLVHDGRAIALVGRSTSGKSTTALAAARNGMRLYSDELCTVQRGLVVSHLRAVTIREGGRRALLTNDRGTAFDAVLRAVPSSGDVTLAPSKLGIAAGGPPVPLAALVLLEDFADAPELRSITHHRALPLILRSMSSADRGIDRLARALATFRDVPTFMLRVGPAHETALAVEGVGEVLARS